MDLGKIDLLTQNLCQPKKSCFRDKISQSSEAHADTLMEEIRRYSKASEHPIKNPGKNPTVHLATPNIPPENGKAENNSLEKYNKIFFN